MGKPRFTKYEDQFIADNYLLLPVNQIAIKLDRSETGINFRLRAMKLEIPQYIKDQRKLMGRRKPGDIPFNKGRKQIDYMTADMIDRTKATRFKAGQVPHNCYKEVGKITTRGDHPERNGGNKYKFICIAIGKWKLLHKHIWEELNGPVPKGFCLWFKDGDPMNCVIENLEMITRKENRIRNHPSKFLTDRFVANTLAWRNEDLKQEIIAKHPELIKLKRNQLKLKQAIKNESNAD
ncbi:MAG: HNH endonuclease signature motif containing protein [Daejeonella sp.]